MELRHLRYFLAAADELHFGRAADALFVTRPAVSQTISDLETELGVQLFFRHAHKVTLTAAGAALQRHTRTLLNDLGRAVEVARSIGSGKVGYLNLGYGTLSLQHPLFRAALKQLRSRHAGIDVTLHEMASSAQIPAVRSGKLDVGFVVVADEALERPGSVPEFMSILDLGSLELERGELSAAVPADHPLAARARIGFADLAAHGMIVVQRSNVIPGQSRLEAMFRERGLTLRVVQEVANIVTQVNLIAAGMGVGLVVNTPGMQYPDSVRLIPLEGVAFPVRFCLVWRKDPVEPVLGSFIATVRELAAGGSAAE